jgi:RNA polymerase sigma factor (TIGR02999 family)
MRRILVDSARRKHSLKRGGAATLLPLDEALIQADEPAGELLALDDALGELERQHPDHAKLVKLRYFAGLTMPQAAEALGVPLRTAERNWTYAKAWLLQAMAAEA